MVPNFACIAQAWKKIEKMIEEICILKVGKLQ